MRSDRDENITFYSESKIDMCELKVSSYKKEFFTLDDTSPPSSSAFPPEPLMASQPTVEAMNVEEEEGGVEAGSTDAEEQYIAIRTALGDDLEDIQETLKLYDYLKSATELVDTQTLTTMYVFLLVDF